MAELKRNFLKSRMNKDLDERLISNGEYRDATNIEITTSESSQTGTVQTLSGNTKWDEALKKGAENLINTSSTYTSAQTVGYYCDNENNAVYNFVAGASDLRVSEVTTDFYNYIGKKSDLIEQITPHKTNPSATVSKVVFNDVYESRLIPTVDSVTNDTIIGVPMTICYLDSVDEVFADASGVRVGMRVQLISYDGVDAWGADNEIYVTDINMTGPTSMSISITPVIGVTSAYTATNRSEGLVLKFSAPRILNFNKGNSKELEANVVGGSKTFTPTNSYISAINVIDDFLFWTDGRNEPKKINIKRFIAGSSMKNAIGPGSYVPFTLSSQLPHTRLVTEAEKKLLALGPAKEEHITVIRPNPNCSMKAVGTVNGETNILVNIPIYGRTPGTEEVFGPFAFSSNTNVLFTSATQIEIQPQISLANNWTEGSIIRLTGQTSAAVVNIKVNSISETDDGETYYTVSIQGELPSGYSGTTADEVWLGQQLPKENLYTDDFIRFAYRYRYVDGEYSCISPYTQPVFLPGSYSYSPKDGFNIGMLNTLDTIELSDFVNPDIPHDVVEVELLFKSQKSDNVYAFTSFKIKQSSYSNPTSLANGSLKPSLNIQNSYSISEKLFGYTLPSDQLTRNFDAVPRKSIAQEIMGNRLMYANHTQDYDLLDSSNNAVKLDLNPQTTQQIVNYGSDFNSVDIFWGSNPPYVAETITTANAGVGPFSPFSYNTQSLVLPSEYDPGNNFSNTGSTPTYGYTVPANGYYTISASAWVKGYQHTDWATSSPSSLSSEPRIATLAISEVNTTVGADFRYPINGQLNTVLQQTIEHPISGEAVTDSILTEYLDEDNYLINIDSTEVYLQAGKVYGLFVFSSNSGYLGTNEFTIKNVRFAVEQAPATTYSLANQKGLSSIKSMRNYSLGVVYRDRFGRESSVLTGDYEDLNVTKQESGSVQKIKTQIKSKAPYWAETYKYFIKENAIKFYNMVLESAWLAPDTDYAYIVFNSVDKNKIKTGDYLIGKKKHNVNEAITDTDAKWRIVSIIGELEVVAGGFALDGQMVPAAILASNDDADGKFFVKVNYDSAFINYIANLSGDTNYITSEGSNNGAVFETETSDPLDLDLYYEISPAYAVKLDDKNAKTHIRKGCSISISGAPSDSNLYVNSNNKPKVFSAEGAKTSGVLQLSNNVNDAFCKVIFTGDSTHFIQYDPYDPKVVSFAWYDGSITTAYLAKDIQVGDPYMYVSQFVHHDGTLDSFYALPTTLGWYNCISFGNGVESDTIRDDFNNVELLKYTPNGKQSGFKSNLASIDYEEFTQKNEIIFSQIYNESAGSNRFNEFLTGQNIIKRINPDYGSIQKLYSRDSDLLTLCEKKCLRVLSQKDALFNADGKQQLLATDKVLGQAVPFSGDYGISKNPESFAADEYRVYFTDKDRGAVLRLSKDGLTPISNVGMRDWFSDQLINSKALIGSFDSNKEEYNLTIHEVISPRASKNVYTLSFNETIDGWASFKSFIPEAGFTINNRYFTFKNGYMYQHHSSLAEKNNFYGKHVESDVTVIFNDEVSSVKTFNTMAYEGSQAKVSYSSARDGQYYNLKDKEGWYVESVKTDLQEAKTDEFINKEGKYFSNIKGITTTHTNFIDGGTLDTTNLDSSEFSLQGLERLSSGATLYSGTMPSAGYDLIVTVSADLESDTE